VTAVEPVGEPRKALLHQLASREVCGFDGCPSRLHARQHMRERGFVVPGTRVPGNPTQDDETVMSGPPEVVGHDEVKA
jgi:hypothetical protein